MFPFRLSDLYPLLCDIFGLSYSSSLNDNQHHDDPSSVFSFADPQSGQVLSATHTIGAASSVFVFSKRPIVNRERLTQQGK